MFLKDSYRYLGAGKKIKISTILLSLHSVMIIITNLFHWVFNISVFPCSRKTVIACVFDIMTFDNMLQIFFN